MKASDLVKAKADGTTYLVIKKFKEYPTGCIAWSIQDGKGDRYVFLGESLEVINEVGN